MIYETRFVITLTKITPRNNQAVQSQSSTAVTELYAVNTLAQLFLPLLNGNKFFSHAVIKMYYPCSIIGEHFYKCSVIINLIFIVNCGFI